MSPARPKDIGTQGETYTARYLLPWWPSVERRVLHGINDRGDLLGTPGLTWSVKAGKAAENASLLDIKRWLAELDGMTLRNNDQFGILVTKRKGAGMRSVGTWWGHMRADAFASLVCRNGYQAVNEYDGLWPQGIRLPMDDLIPLLLAAGFGTPLVPA